VLSWAFGLATTILLVSIWGRSIVVSPATMSAAGADLATAGVVVSQIETLVSDAVSESLGIDRKTAARLTDNVMVETHASEAITAMIEDVIVAATARNPEEATIDVAAHLRPVAREVAESAQEMGYDIDEAAIANAISSLDPIVIRRAGEPPALGPGSPVARSFGVATLISGAGMLVTGAALLGLSGWSRKALRSLLARIAISGFTFSVFLQVSGWVVDPAGGRAPVRSALAELLLANAWVGLAVGALPAVAWYVTRRRVRPVAGFQDSDG